MRKNNRCTVGQQIGRNGLKQIQHIVKPDMRNLRTALYKITKKGEQNNSCRGYPRRNQAVQPPVHIQQPGYLLLILIRNRFIHAIQHGGAYSQFGYGQYIENIGQKPVHSQVIHGKISDQHGAACEGQYQVKELPEHIYGHID